MFYLPIQRSHLSFSHITLFFPYITLLLYYNLYKTIILSFKISTALLLFPKGVIIFDPSISMTVECFGLPLLFHSPNYYPVLPSRSLLPEFHWLL